MEYIVLNLFCDYCWIYFSRWQTNRRNKTNTGISMSRYESHWDVLQLLALNQSRLVIFAIKLVNMITLCLYKVPYFIPYYHVLLFRTTEFNTTVSLSFIKQCKYLHFCRFCQFQVSILAENIWQKVYPFPFFIGE